MQKLLDFSEYASTLIPKNKSDELTILARRIQFICATYVTQYNYYAETDDAYDTLKNLEDVSSTDKVITQLNEISQYETEH